jgi:hypothetical protein
MLFVGRVFYKLITVLQKMLSNIQYVRAEKASWDLANTTQCVAKRSVGYRKIFWHSVQTRRSAVETDDSAAQANHLENFFVSTIKNIFDSATPNVS